jgi:DNA-binding IscR family transcriptional regulator
LILLELKNARIVESVRGAKGGYKLRRPPSEIYLSEIIRLIDGPLAPFGDAEQLRSLIHSDTDHRVLYQVFLDVRNAAARILEHTTLADIAGGRGARKLGMFLISGVWQALSQVGPEDRSFRNRRPRTEQAARPLEVEAMVSPIY